ncbi:MAG: c-type cytochrome [Nitrospirota bacterium]
MSKKILAGGGLGVLGLAVLVSVLLAAPAHTQEPAKKTAADAPSVDEGKKIYDKYCAWCHGEKGAGDGPGAKYQLPRPRDFTSGAYKFRFTPSGDPPLDEDIYKSVAEGFPGTSMPPWKHALTEKQMWAVTHYLKTFSDAFKDAKPKKIEIAKQISPSKESIEKGAKLYKDLKCWECHGDEGRGDGPSAKDLKDDWGNPIRASDLTQPWTYRGGATHLDIFRNFTTGLNGTPMPSYADTNSDEDRWHLANYVRSMAPAKDPSVATLLSSAPVKGPIPDDPEAAAWKNAREGFLPFMPQIVEEPRHFTPMVTAAFVRSLYNDDEIAFLIRWSDPTESKDGAAVDAFAVQFPAREGEAGTKPYFLDGDEENPVMLWLWKHGAAGAVELLGKGLKAAGPNPKPGTFTKTVASYKKGEYKLLVKYSLKDRPKGAVSFAPGVFIPVALQVWDGGNGEEGPKKGVTTWYWLTLEKPTPVSVYLYTVLAVVGAVAAQGWIVRRVRRS